MNPSTSVIIQNIDESVYKLQKEGILNMEMFQSIWHLCLGVSL